MDLEWLAALLAFFGCCELAIRLFDYLRPES
jgi:hypothetical protein